MENMDVEKNFATLGDYLRFHREQRQITVEELSHKTKIRIQQLQFLESNLLDKLPPTIYLVGFIKSICHTLSCDPEAALKFIQKVEIVEPVLEIRQPGKVIKPLHFNFKFFDKSKIKINQKALAAVVLTFMIGGSFLSNLHLENKSHKDSSASVHTKMSFLEAVKLVKKDDVTQEDVPDKFKVDPALATPQAKVEEFATFIPAPLVALPFVMELPVTAPAQERAPAAVVPAASLKAPAAAPKTKLAVKAKKGTAFLVYRVNGEKKNKIYLRNGRTLELEGNEIKMEVGNPDAVEFTKNGEPLELKPEPGQSTLQLQF